MPLFSAFTPFGALAFSSRRPHGQDIYESMVRNLGGAYDMTVGGHHEAKVYARSRSIARAQYALDRAANQYDGNKAVEMLPGLERDYGIVPNQTDTLLSRQQAVATRQAIPQYGAEYLAISNALRSLLGTDFVKLRALTAAERTLSAATPVGNFTRPELPPRQVLLTEPVPIGAWTATYANADASAAPIAILKGDSLVIDPGNSGLVEIVTVTAATASTLTATFTKSHAPGTFASTQNFPNWWSTQRSYLVMLTEAAALDPEKTRKVHDLMARVTRGVTTWAIVWADSGALTSAEFILGGAQHGKLGITTIGAIPYTLP